MTFTPDAGNSLRSSSPPQSELPRRYSSSSSSRRSASHVLEAVRRVSSDSEGSSRWPHTLAPRQLTPTTSPVPTRRDMHHCHSNNSLPQPTEGADGKGRSRLRSESVNILEGVRCVSAFGGLSFSPPSVRARRLRLHNEMF